MDNPKIIVRKDYSGMADFLVSLIKETASGKEPGNALNIALSGGTTPQTIFEHLISGYGEQIRQLPLRFFQVDERCVPPDHPESNYRMIKQSLLSGLEISEGSVFRMRGENDPFIEAERYGKVMMENIPLAGKWPVFDLMLLGLGDDGHTASLFPGDEKILHSENLCEVAAHPLTGQRRITLTLPVINHSENILFLVTGKLKSQVVSRILQGSESEYLPAAMVSPLNGSLCWLIDREAVT